MQRLNVLAFFTLCLLLSGNLSYGQCNASFAKNKAVLCDTDSLILNSLAPVGLIYSQWDFGNGDTLNALDTQYRYAAPGTYVIRHIVEDNSACRDTAYDTVQVFQTPLLFFSTDLNCQDDSVHLYGNYLTGTGDTLGTLRWWTGTGDSLEGDTVAFAYPSSGYYSLSLQGTGKGCTVKLDSTVFIRQRPQAAFLIDTNSCFGDSMRFTGQGSAYSPSYRWNFGDVLSGLKNTDSVANPKHRFTQAGLYQVRMVLSDTLGCRDTIIRPVRIHQAAIAAIHYNEVCTGSATEFGNVSGLGASDSIRTIRWDFGDGDSALIAFPTHTYADSGSYQVRLVLSTYAGCRDTSEESILIHPQPVIQLDLDSVCRGSNVNFQLISSTNEIQSYQWTFGDGFTSSSSSPQHQYTVSGKYAARLQLIFNEGKSCQSAPDSVTVLALPSASFLINEDTQCFRGNEVCVHLQNQSPLVKTRRVIFDDGFVQVDQGPTDTFVCHTYADAAGGTYFIAIQMLDSNGCSQTYSLDSGVLIYPEFATGFSQSSDSGCFSTNVDFINMTNQPLSNITRYYWDFGDGTQDSTNWDTAYHTYTTNGNFNVKLVAENQQGCLDSATGASSINNTSYTVDGQIDSLPSACASNNRLYVHQSFVSGAQIRWYWGTEDSSSVFSPSYMYEFPGTYHPRLRISLNGCDSVVYLDTVDILGPYARFGPITNRFQCEITDTVYFVNNSIYYKNSQRGAFWDFGDGFAPSCTTNYEAGINATGNCRYSTDSTNTKHMYDRNQENCYYTRLIAYDNFSGCGDTVVEYLPLTAPVASPDPLNGFNGLFTIQSQTCLGPEEEKEISISLTQTQPNCGRQSYWVLWDSSCAAASGNINNFWVPLATDHNYDYDNAPCDPEGYVSMGLIIQNGSDSLGNVCRDTAWYHNILQFNLMDPRFGSSYDSSQYYCTGSSFDFYLSRPNQDSVNRVIWSWGDGTQTDTNTTDTVSHQYTTSGQFTVTTQVFTVDGCVGSDSGHVRVGVTALQGYSNDRLCVGDSFQLLPVLNYVNDPSLYWEDSARLSQNKEALLYDLGDGNGFNDLGAQPWIDIDGVRQYYIRVAYRDSAGCWDTLSYADTLKSYGIYAAFGTQLDTFLCPQSIAFTNGSSVFDSTAGFAQTQDSVAAATWVFGNGLANSTLLNPERYLGTGSYSVKLIAQNTIGCKDSVVHDLVVVGPVARYSFTSDSSGCETLRVYFENQSTNASNYVWQFNDSGNAVTSTASDTNFYFDYERFGNFVPTLTAQGSFNQDGIVVSCESVFPDSTAWDSLRLISVYERGTPEFSFVTDCATRQVTFTNSSSSIQAGMQFLWEFGDGDTSSSSDPVHTYSDTGHYTVILHVITDKGCEDTVSAEVTVAPNPEAWFTFNETCLGSYTQFEDSTNAFNDAIYDWQWDFGDGGTSILDNPDHLYAQDTLYTVNLVVTNIAGCRDTVQRSIRIHSIPTAAFSATAVCRYDSVSFTQLSTNEELPLSYQWDFGDGGSSVLTAPRHKYGTSGNKLVTLIATSSYSCADTLSQFVNVYQEPTASFTINDRDQCLSSQQFVFSDQSTAGTGGYSVSWNYGDGNTGSGDPGGHQYGTPGTYLIHLYLNSVVGCRDTALDSVTVNPQAIAGFLLNDNAQCENENIYLFADTSVISQGSLTRSWQTGDGTSYSDSSVTHHYADTGTFTLRLIQLSDAGCRDTVDKTIYVNPSPRAAFVINDSTQCLGGNLFAFTNTTQLAKGNFTSGWDFGDGSQSGSLNPIHTYSQDSSVWTIRLIVTSDSLCRDTVSHSGTTYPMPEARFSIADSAQCFRDNLFHFADSGSIKSGTLDFRWYFGDGDSSSLQHPTHSYGSAGSYTVTQVSSSSFLCRDTFENQVVVYPQPEARIGLGDSIACFRGHFFVFADSGSLSSGSWQRVWKFGDGNSDTLEMLSHSYDSNGVYTAWLVVESEFGCMDSVSRQYEVYPQAEAVFAINDSVQCDNGHNFVFTNQSQINAGSMAYDWRFGDGDSSAQQHPSHQYSVFGDYTVRLVANSPYGCSDTTEKAVRIDPNPQAVLWLADSGQCVNEQLFAFADSSSLAEGNYQITWHFGDGDSSIQNDPVHTYGAAGNYTVRQLLISDKGCRDSSSLAIDVYPKPQVAFGVNDSIQCFNGHVFVFQNLSVISSGSLSYDWRFGDGDSSSLQHPDHQYAVYGDYMTRLVTSSDQFCRDTAWNSIRINPNPQAAIWLNDSFQCLNEQAFVFRDSGSIAEGNYQVTWYFGDGDSNILQDVSHTYSIEGSYQIMQVLQSDKSCMDTALLDLEVYPRPFALFAVNDSIQCFDGHRFDFLNQSVINAGVLRYDWRFDDGDSSQLQNPSYTYGTFGDYRVRLVTYSDHDCKDTAYQDLRINPNPEARIWLNDSFQCLNDQSFEFRDSSLLAEGAYLREWNFGDGNTDTSRDLIHTYIQDGPYTVRLLLESDKNCRDSAFVSTEAYPTPLPVFTINDSGQCVNTNDFAFTNTSTIHYGWLRYEWSFGDGLADTNGQINHTYLSADTFHVVLSAISNFGCIDSVSRDIIAFPKPQSNWVINDTAQCVNTNDFRFQAQVQISSGNLKNYWWDLESLLDSGDLDTARTYLLAGTYPVYFYAQSELDCWDTLQNVLTVHPKPSAVYQVNDSDQCLNTQHYVFSNQSTLSAGSLHYFWEFGDGDTSSDFEPVKLFQQHDTLTTVLYAISDLGCYDTTDHTLIVFPVPDVSFSYNDSDQCVNGNYFVFTNESTIDYGILSYTWDLGNGMQAVSADTNMVYSVYGTYPVWLWAESNVGCRDSLRKDMIVYPKPNPGFSENDPGQCVNTQDFRFTDQSNIAYGNLHYTYRFGDGTEDTLASPAHYYPAFGVYTVRQVLESDYGCMDSVESGVQAFAKPQALFTINDRDQCINTQDFRFSSQSNIAEGSLQDVFWDFDDGNTANGPNTANYYLNSGTYDVRLLALSDSFCYDTLFKSLRVYPKPVAAIGYNDSAQCHSTNLYEVYSLAFDSSGVANWYWDIDTDSNASDSSFRFHFDTYGPKTFTHRLVSQNGCWDTISRDAYVKPMPDPSFTGLRTFHCDNEAAFALSPVTPGGIFDGKNIANQLYQPRLLWEDTVRYWVEVNGCADSSYEYTNVYPFPVVELGEDTVLCKNEFLLFDVSFWSSDYLWQDDKESARYRASKPGMYRVTVSNICGSASDSLRISYLDDLCRIYVPTAFTPNKDIYNSYYKPVTFGLDEMQYSIFTRWGEKVFEGNLDDEGWDGTFGGVPVQIDVYVVVVRYSYTLHGETISGYLRENVTLLR